MKKIKRKVEEMCPGIYHVGVLATDRAPTIEVVDPVTGKKRMERTPEAETLHKLAKRLHVRCDRGEVRLWQKRIEDDCYEYHWGPLTKLMTPIALPHIARSQLMAGK